MSQQNQNNAPRLEDRFAIQQAILRWCRGADRMDWDLVRSAFHPDATDDHGMYRGGLDGLVAWLQERHKTITCSMHCLSNVLVEFSGENSAVAESYVLAYQRYDPPEGASREQVVAALGETLANGELPVDIFMPARYVDEFERRNDDWRIAKRTTVFEGRQVLGHGAPSFHPDWQVGRRDGDDPMFVVRRRAGLD
ncbi:MAG: nuclear transport factor 2 family protein [Chromatiales bacterium]|nr:nuclear transport factor 2 family protein [Chromatiales bacterium]